MRLPLLFGSLHTRLKLTMTSVGLPSLNGSLILEHSHQVLTWHADGRQLDDPLDAIAVHGWCGTWGVIAVGLFASETLITNSYGLDQSGNGRPYGCFFPGSNGALLAAQIAYALWIAGAHFALHSRQPATQ
jgi:ammonia channel protein AmtB